MANLFDSSVHGTTASPVSALLGGFGFVGRFSWDTNTFAGASNR